MERKYNKTNLQGRRRQDPSNYRGIAVSSCFSKLFSWVFFNRLDKYIEDNELIYSEQIGVRKKR